MLSTHSFENDLDLILELMISNLQVLCPTGLIGIRWLTSDGVRLRICIFVFNRNALNFEVLYLILCFFSMT